MQANEAFRMLFPRPLMNHGYPCVYFPVSLESNLKIYEVSRLAKNVFLSYSSLLTTVTLSNDICGSVVTHVGFQILSR